MTLKQKIEELEALRGKLDSNDVMWSCEDGHILSFSQFDIDRKMVPRNGALVGFCFPKITAKYPTAQAELIILSRNTIFELIDALKEAEKLILECNVCLDFADLDVWLSKYNGGE